VENPLLHAIWAANPARSEATLARRLLKLSEELGEVSEAYLNVTSAANAKNKTWDDVREELCDLLIVTVDCLLTPLAGERGVPIEVREAEIGDVVEAKLAKWTRALKAGTVPTL
jgi:NTP pyrophosphatase (non-canonical NTP hydrolase)